MRAQHALLALVVATAPAMSAQAASLGAVSRGLPDAPGRSIDPVRWQPNNFRGNVSRSGSANVSRNANVNHTSNVNVNGNGHWNGPGWGGVAAGVAVGAGVGAAATTAAHSAAYPAPYPYGCSYPYP